MSWRHGVLAVAFTGANLSAQDLSSAIAVERVVVQFAVARSSGSLSKAIVAVNPVLVREGTAPGWDSTGVRPSERAAALNEIGIKTRRREDVIFCAQRVCEFKNANVFLSLSEPRIVGDNAEVSVTIDMPSGPRRQYYETLHLKLEAIPTGWRIVSITQLGIS